MKNECCSNPNNLIREIVEKDKSIDTCKACGRRHIRMRAEPGVVGTYFGKK